MGAGAAAEGGDMTGELSDAEGGAAGAAGIPANARRSLHTAMIAYGRADWDSIPRLGFRV
jgi:hypothetical protein